MSATNLNILYSNLLSEFGHPAKYWPQWCAVNKTQDDREKIIIGMILVQRTSWHNANIALKNLKKENLLSLSKIANLKSPNLLTNLIRPAGFYQSNPQRLFDICQFFVRQKNIFQVKRDDLLAIKGIGPKTADTILLYALDQPVFIIDEYTCRFVVKYNLSLEHDYYQLQNFFQKNLKPDLSSYQNFHALIIISLRGREKSKMEIV